MAPGVLRGRAKALTPPASTPPCQLAPLFEYREGAWGTRHEEAIATGDQALDVARIRVGMAARDVVLLTNRQNTVDGLGHHGVLILSGVAEFLTQVTLADQDHADARDFLQDAGEIRNRPHLFTLDNRQ